MAKQSPISALDNLRTNYYDFHQDLCRFLALLKDRCTTEASAVLQQLDCIPDHFPVDDPDFARGEVDGIRKKTFDVTDVVKVLLRHVRPFVLSAHQNWFAEQGGNMYGSIITVKQSLTSLLMDVDKNTGGHVVVSAGAGGVNMGVTINDSIESEKKLRQLEDALRDLDKPK